MKLGAKHKYCKKLENMCHGSRWQPKSDRDRRRRCTDETHVEERSEEVDSQSRSHGSNQSTHRRFEERFNNLLSRFVFEFTRNILRATSEREERAREYWMHTYDECLDCQCPGTDDEVDR